MKRLIGILVFGSIACNLILTGCSDQGENGTIRIYKTTRVRPNTAMSTITSMKKKGWDFMSAYGIIERRPAEKVERIVLIARHSWELVSLMPPSSFSIDDDGVHVVPDYELLFRISILF